MVSKSLLSLIFLSVILALCGLRALDIAVILGVTSVQIAVGASVWLAYRSKYQVRFAETVGMGAAIGFTLALTSSQLFRTVSPRAIGWTILPLFALVIALKILKNKTLSFVNNENDVSEILIIVSGTLIALSTSWYWLIPTAVAISFLTMWAILRINKESVTSKHKLFINLVGTVGVILLARAMPGLNALENIRNPVWWSWRFAKIQDPDVLFIESMMHSVGMFGNTDNIFFAEAKIQYHWLSFAWNDTLNSIFQTDSFAVSGLAAPIIVIFVILCLVVAFAGRFPNSRVTTPLLVLAVSSMCANPIPFIRVFHPYSYSFNFSLIFMFAFVILLMSGDKSKFFANALLIFIFTVGLVGSKISSAPFLVIGLLSANIYSLFKNHKDAKHDFLLSCVSAFAFFLTWYFIYYSATSDGPGSIKFGLGYIFIQKAFLSAGLPVLVFVIGAVSIVFLILYSLVGFIWIRQIWTLSTRFAITFSLFGGLASLVICLMFYDDGENLAYLIQSAIALILPFSVISIGNSDVDFVRMFKTKLFWVVIGGAVGARISFSILSDVSGDSISVVYKSSGAIVLPLIAGLFLFAITRALFGFSLQRARIVYAVLLISSGTLGSYAAFAAGFYQDGVNYRLLSVDSADTITGSTPYREMLIWLRNNSQDDDLVATNRYCSDSYETPTNCLALWNLTSAISRRQVLVEGLWPSYSENLAPERERRRLLVESFVEEPSVQNRSALLDYGVRWVVADYAVTKKRSWGEFAEVRFTNEAGAILKLTDSDS